MSSVLYTDCNSIRAALGLSDIELSDRTIRDLGVAELVEMALDFIYPDHIALHAAIQDPSTATPEQKAAYRALKFFCQFEAATHFIPQLQLLVAQRVSDGDAEMHRFNASSLEETIGRLLSRRDEFLILLNPTYLDSASVFSPLVRSTPDYDPVTDEGAVL